MTYYQLLTALNDAKRWSDKHDECKAIMNNSSLPTHERAAAESKMNGFRIMLSQEIIL